MNMNSYLKIYFILFVFILLISVVQTAERRFQSFDNYLNIGYGNVPYSKNYK